MSGTALLSAFLGGCATLAAVKVKSLYDTIRLDTIGGTEGGALSTTCRQRFQTFASIVQNVAPTTADGIPSRVRYMAAPDFVASLTQDATDDLPEKLPKRLRRIYNAIDDNGDGKLSYEEYSAVVTLLGAPEDSLRRCFLICCDAAASSSSSTGTKRSEEAMPLKNFSSFVAALAADPSFNGQTPQQGAKLAEHLFGKRNMVDGRLTYKQLLEVLDTLQSELFSVAFSRADPRGTGVMSLSDFRRVVFRQPMRKDIAECEDVPPMPKQKAHTRSSSASRRAKRREEMAALTSAGFTKQDLVEVTHLVKQAPRWLEPLRLYAGRDGERKVTPQVFHRACRAAGLSTSPRASVAAFRVFDLDGSGELELEEVKLAARAAAAWTSPHVVDFGEPERNPVQRFFKCMKQRD